MSSLSNDPALAMKNQGFHGPENRFSGKCCTKITRRAVPPAAVGRLTCCTIYH
jgi:hypothetical protein